MVLVVAGFYFRSLFVWFVVLAGGTLNIVIFSGMYVITTVASSCVFKFISSACSRLLVLLLLRSLGCVPFYSLHKCCNPLILVPGLVVVFFLVDTCKLSLTLRLGIVYFPPFIFHCNTHFIFLCSVPILLFAAGAWFLVL